MSLKSGKKWVTWYKSERSDWFGINYHIGILVYSESIGNLHFFYICLPDLVCSNHDGQYIQSMRFDSSSGL